jgi:hypothetical protein
MVDASSLNWHCFYASGGSSGRHNRRTSGFPEALRDGTHVDAHAAHCAHDAHGTFASHHSLNSVERVIKLT